MNINFKDLAKTAIVVGTLAASMGANAFTNNTDSLTQTSQKILASCQVPDSVYSFHAASFSTGTVALLEKVVGPANVADVYAKSGACEILAAGAAEVTGSTSWDAKKAAADKATDVVVGTLGNYVATEYATELVNLFGVQQVHADILDRANQQNTPASVSYDSGFEM